MTVLIIDDSPAIATRLIGQRATGGGEYVLPT